MALPTFPENFTFAAYKKEFDENFPKRQNELLKSEMTKIYDLVKAHAYRADNRINFVKFELDNKLALGQRRYLIQELLNRFPKIECQIHTSTNRSNYYITEVTDEVAYAMYYVIDLTD